jgi:hypothetical protein
MLLRGSRVGVRVGRLRRVPFEGTAGCCGGPRRGRWRGRYGAGITRPRILYVSELGYQAKGRRYCDEDIDLSARLDGDFDVAVCHPSAAGRLMNRFDVVVVRNSGPVIHDMSGYEAFQAAALASGIPVFTDLRGQADQVGKQYLLDLFAAGYPVIPTVDDLDHLDRLPAVDDLVVKPRFGADSLGLEFVTRDDLATLDLQGRLLHPASTSRTRSRSTSWIARRSTRCTPRIRGAVAARAVRGHRHRLRLRAALRRLERR